VRVDVQLEMRVRGLQERAHARPQLGPQVEVRQVVQAGRLAGRRLRRQQRPQPRARRLVHLQRSGSVCHRAGDAAPGRLTALLAYPPPQLALGRLTGVQLGAWSQARRTSAVRVELSSV